MSIYYSNLYKKATTFGDYSEYTNTMTSIDELKMFITKNAIKTTMPLVIIMYYQEQFKNNIFNITSNEGAGIHDVGNLGNKNVTIFHENECTSDITKLFNKLDIHKLKETIKCDKLQEEIELLKKENSHNIQKYNDAFHYLCESEKKMEILQEECNQYQDRNNILEEKVNFTQNEMLLLLKENKNLKSRIELYSDLLSKMDMQHN